MDADEGLACWFYDRFTRYPPSYPTRYAYPLDVWVVMEYLDAAYAASGPEGTSDGP